MDHLRRIYFIGIGGIGMSALARYFKDQGKEIFGYDKTETALTKKLVEEGMKIHYDDDVRKIPEGIDLVIYTPAIPPDHEELNYFKRNFYIVKKRAEVLGLISKSKNCIAIAGTHGKTTTSSFVAHVLNEGGFKASALIGGIMVNYQSNYIKGENDWIVVEADEFDRSFLHLEPQIGVVMSIDPDHLDIYGREDEMKKAFEAFTLKIVDDGVLLIKKGLLNFFSNKWQDEINRKGIRVIEIGFDLDVFGYENIEYRDSRSFFSFRGETEDVRNVSIQMPGQHNVENASVAIAIGQLLGLDSVKIVDALKDFRGISRRFEFILKDDEPIFIDDYAHHPTELNAAIETVRKMYPDKNITGVFQPHLYSRTRDFAEGFAEALDQLDEIILLDIYPARELPIPGVTSELIMQMMKNKQVKLMDKKTLLTELKNRKLEVLITLGAGDIDAEIEKIKEIIRR